VSLRDVIEAVEGPLAAALHMEPEGDGSSRYRPDFLWQQLAARFARDLEELTLARLCREAARAEVERARRDVPMYHI
jgi:DNA-binding IscR family transcriptional regulator